MHQTEIQNGVDRPLQEKILIPLIVSQGKLASSAHPLS